MDKKEEIYPLYCKIVCKILYKSLYNIVALNIQRFGVYIQIISELCKDLGLVSKSSLALLSVVSRCSLGGIRQGIRKGKKVIGERLKARK